MEDLILLQQTEFRVIFYFILFLFQEVSFAFGQKEDTFTVSNTETKFPSCVKGLPALLITFPTGGAAFDIKSLWQFTSELLFI